jgi:hypothetical protein
MNKRSLVFEGIVNFLTFLVISQGYSQCLYVNTKWYIFKSFWLGDRNVYKEQTLKRLTKCDSKKELDFFFFLWLLSDTKGT